MIMENLKSYFGGNIMGKNNPLFERMTDSLNEALQDAKANKKTLKRTRRTMAVVEAKAFDKNEVKLLRNKLGMSQHLFGLCLGVTQKTVEAWESGRNIPSGCACRLMSLFEMNNNLAIEYNIIRSR